MKKIDILREALSKSSAPNDKVKELVDKAPESIKVFGIMLKKVTGTYAKDHIIEYVDYFPDDSLSFNIDLKKPGSTIYIFPSSILMDFGPDTSTRDVKKFSAKAQALWQTTSALEKTYFKLSRQADNKKTDAALRELEASESRLKTLMTNEFKAAVEKDISKAFPGYTLAWKK